VKQGRGGEEVGNGEEEDGRGEWRTGGARENRRDGTFRQPLMKHARTTVPRCPGGGGCVAQDGDGRTDLAAAVGEPLLRFDGSRRNAV
jgi:hypothetical protein